MYLDFQFDESSHTYSRAGVVIPGVTRVIEGVGLTSFENVRQDVLERRGNLGKHVHRCCHFFDEGDLEWSSVSDEAKGYVESWGALCQDLGITRWRRIEFQCVAEIDGMPVGMRIDREGLITGEESIVEIKISRQAEPWHGIQLAFYSLGLPHEELSTPMAKFARRKRYVAKLHEHGKKARLIPYFDRRDADVARSALAVSHWKLAQGRKISSLELEQAA
jgi:hypothetical protein